jgi:hypothetical protein
MAPLFSWPPPRREPRRGAKEKRRHQKTHFPGLKPACAENQKEFFRLSFWHLIFWCPIGWPEAGHLGNKGPKLAGKNNRPKRKNPDFGPHKKDPIFWAIIFSCVPDSSSLRGGHQVIMASKNMRILSLRHLFSLFFSLHPLG